MRKIISTIASIFVLISLNTASLAVTINPDLYKIIKYDAKAETDYFFSSVNVNDPDMPYDVKWNYGKDYEAIIAKYDWSKVFDAGYYKKAFPTLAKLYHNDDEKLLRHFVTVGIHEGRQGNESFNPSEYAKKVDKKVSDLLKDRYEGYYLQYMSEANPKKYPGKDSPKQAKIVLTALQKEELEGTNKYRKENNACDITLDSELNALASYRAYVDAKGSIMEHHWLDDEDNYAEVWDMLHKLNLDWGSESTIKRTPSLNSPHYYKGYYTSTEHKKRLLDDTNRYIGVSNSYYNKDHNYQTQFHIYAKDEPKVDFWEE